LSGTAGSIVRKNGAEASHFLSVGAHIAFYVGGGQHRGF